MFEQIDAQMQTTAPWVQMWMNWMMVIFLASVVFVKGHVEARLALLSMIATMGVAMILFVIWENVHLFGISHLLFWGPLAYFIIGRWRESGEQKYQTWGPYKIWAALLLLTIGVSLPFDVYDIVMVALGNK